MFGFNDPPLLQALSKKKFPITIYYDKKNSPALLGDGVHPISSPGLMHQKILILDEETVFMGSANFTGPSLKMHDNLVIGFKSKEIASFLQENAPLKSGQFQSTVGGQDVEIHLLPSANALEDLKNKIKMATKTLYIAIFTLTHPELTQEIINAKNRGVDVTVILDMHASLGASAKALKSLEDDGVRVLLSQGLQLMHHKFAYIDETLLISGSANWTKSAFTKNHDCLITLYNLTQEQKHFMNKIWYALKTKSIKKPLL